MNRQTPILETITAADGREKFDAACKRFLSHREILARIIKSCIPEYGGCTIDEIAEKYIEGTPQVDSVPIHRDAVPPRIQGANTVDSSMKEGEYTFDIRFHALLPKEVTDKIEKKSRQQRQAVRVSVDMEAQGRYYVGYPLIARGFYLCARMLSSEYGTVFTGQQFEKLEKVYSIWLVHDAPKKYRNSITRYSAAEHNDVHGRKKFHAHPSAYDLMNVIVIMVGDRNETENDLIKMLDTYFDVGIGVEEKLGMLEQEFGIKMTEEIKEEVQDMSSLGAMIAERSERKGRREGRREGRIIESVNIFRNDMRWDNDRILETITQRFGLSKEDAMGYILTTED